MQLQQLNLQVPDDYLIRNFQPESDMCTKKDIIHLLSKINVRITESDINSINAAKRSKSTNATSNSQNRNSPPIFVKLANRENPYSGRTDTSSNEIIPTCEIIEIQLQLDFNNFDFKHIFTVNGRIYVKQLDTSAPRRIRSMDEVVQLLRITVIVKVIIRKKYSSGLVFVLIKCHWKWALLVYWHTDSAKGEILTSTYLT